MTPHEAQRAPVGAHVIDSLELNAGPLGLLFLPEDVFRRKTNQLVRIVRIGLRVQVYNSAE